MGSPHKGGALYRILQHTTAGAANKYNPLSTVHALKCNGAPFHTFLENSRKQSSAAHDPTPERDYATRLNIPHHILDPRTCTRK